MENLNLEKLKESAAKYTAGIKNELKVNFIKDISRSIIENIYSEENDPDRYYAKDGAADAVGEILYKYFPSLPLEPEDSDRLLMGLMLTYEEEFKLIGISFTLDKDGTTLKYCGKEVF